MKKLGLAAVLVAIGATAASAQGVEFRLGDSDRGWDRGSRERVIVRERRGDWDDDRMMRRRFRNVETTGSIGCRTTVVRRMDSHGRMVKRTIRECED